MRRDPSFLHLLIPFWTKEHRELNYLRLLFALCFSFTAFHSFAQDSSSTDFGRDIWPIIENRCIECHGPEKQKEGLRFDDLEWLSDDELLGAGDASESLIFELVTLEEGEEGYMPDKREPLSGDELVTLERWLNAGADSDGWKVPDVIVVKKTGFKSGKGELVTELAKGVLPVSDALLEPLRALGAVALPLAQNNPLLRIDFELAGAKIEDKHLDLLAPLASHVTILGLGKTSITDAGLSRIAKMTTITQLNLGNTDIGDAGMQHLSGLSNLETLNLVQTKVTDAGLKPIAGLEHLRKLYGWRSGITRAGADSLKSAGADVRVDLGFELSVTDSSE